MNLISWAKPVSCPFRHQDPCNYELAFLKSKKLTSELHTAESFGLQNRCIPSQDPAPDPPPRPAPRPTPTTSISPTPAMVRPQLQDSRYISMQWVQHPHGKQAAEAVLQHAQPKTYGDLWSHGIDAHLACQETTCRLTGQHCTCHVIHWLELTGSDLLLVTGEKMWNSTAIMKSKRCVSMFGVAIATAVNAHAAW